VHSSVGSGCVDRKLSGNVVMDRRDCNQLSVTLRSTFGVCCMKNNEHALTVTLADRHSIITIKEPAFHVTLHNIVIDL